MTRAKLRKVLDPLLALALLGVLTTGVMMEAAKEYGHDLAEIHGAFALVFVILVVAHIWNNWPMLKASFTRTVKRNKPSV